MDINLQKYIQQINEETKSYKKGTGGYKVFTGKKEKLPKETVHAHFSVKGGSSYKLIETKSGYEVHTIDRLGSVTNRTPLKVNDQHPRNAFIDHVVPKLKKG